MESGWVFDLKLLATLKGFIARERKAIFFSMWFVVLFIQGFYFFVKVMAKDVDVSSFLLVGKIISACVDALLLFLIYRNCISARIVLIGWWLVSLVIVLFLRLSPFPDSGPLIEGLGIAAVLFLYCFLISILIIDGKRKIRGQKIRGQCS